MTDRTQEAAEGENPAMIKADLLAGLFFIVLSAASLYGSWTMDRLVNRRINPMTVPGLVPGMLSAALLVCGIVLTLRSLRANSAGGWSALGENLVSWAAQRVVMVLVLTLTYTLGLLGLVPFWLATGLFVIAFILVFEVWMAEPRRNFWQTLPWALGLGIATAAIVTVVFERAFLVRLP